MVMDIADPARRAEPPAPRPALGTVRLEPLRPRHLRAVLDIEQAVYPRPWTSGLFLSELELVDTRRYYVAVDRSPRRGLRPRATRVVGYGGVMVQVGEAHITTLAVHPAEHRRKVASRLLLQLLADAREMGAAAATLEVRAANAGAQRLYHGFGFAPVGVRPRYYTETGEDALIMWLHDLQGPQVADRLSGVAARLDHPGGASGAPDLPVPWVRGRVGLGDVP
jgi:ribosomal-protein-alanine N-acetyltransferase